LEKPCTTTKWKSLINDPHPDRSYDTNTGLPTNLHISAELIHLGLPAVIPQYIADVISWTAIEARITE
jgi:3-deoxy-7-phosphoheptulonate synthase